MNITDFARKARSYALRKLLPTGYYFRSDGYCPCCRSDVVFLASNPWLREGFLCTRCHSVPRQRALLLVLDTAFPNWREMSIHESSPSHGGASRRMLRDCPRYVASQFYPGRPSGTIIDGFRNENLEAQTFGDQIFDLVVTQDVVEHLYEPDKAFREIARTLKLGGAHVFTVPLANRHDETQVWARRGSDGKPDFLFEPEFHGNPVDDQGSPVTMRWGYDIVEYIARACGMETKFILLRDPTFGLHGEELEVLISRKLTD